MYQIVAEERGRRSPQARRHDPERHPEGIRRARHLHLPAAPVDAAGHRHLRLLPAKICPPGTRSRSRGYHIREAGSSAAQEIAFTLANAIAYVEAAVAAGLDVDEFGAAPELLLHLPHQLLRRSRQIPRRPLDVGEIMRERFGAQDPKSLTLALPHPDRRRDADRAAAAEQRRARRLSGAVGGARRHAEPAHQRLRRGAGAADRASRDAGAAHAADYRRRDRRGRHRRSARRFLLRRGADRRSFDARRRRS